jgi:hypothetical protein
MKHLTVLFLLAALSAPLEAANSLPESQTEMIDIWASILYCRAIYEEPNIKNRVYEGDRQSCNQADRALDSHAQNKYSETDAQTLLKHAQHKSAVIRYNTRSVQQAVAACRELCRSYND